jgi:peptide-methionine (S)-S-oxide reductase
VNTTSGAGAPSGAPASSSSTETATLGGGCFWCLEAAFQQLRGVEHIASGYAGGTLANPTYEQVCSGATGHAEVVQVTFDPSVISYHDLLGVYFTIHDPTQTNGQGGDIGTQYRSVIFYASPEQERTARAVVQDLEREHVYDAPIVTQILPLEKFYGSEQYHRDYYLRNPSQPYCQAVVAPKVAKVRKYYFDRLRA